MACKICSSTNQHSFSIESSVAFTGVQRLHLAPIHVCQKTLVCLDCGHAELAFGASELEKFRKGMEGCHPEIDFAGEYSRLH
jgi:hypothetical protein